MPDLSNGEGKDKQRTATKDSGLGEISEQIFLLVAYKNDHRSDDGSPQNYRV